MTSPVVYVVQDHRRYNRDTGVYESVYDLTPAEEFGRLRYLLTPTAAPWNPESIIADLEEGLSKFTSSDYLLMIGNPVLCGLATAIASRISSGRIRFLQWSGKDRRYTAVEAHL